MLVEKVIGTFIVPLDAEDEVSCTESPLQLTGDGEADAETVSGVTVTVIGEEVEVEEPQFVEHVYVPELETVMDCVVSLVDQW